MYLVRRLFCASLVLLMLAAALNAQPPTVAHTVPAALRPGHSTQVTFVGGQLVEPTGLWTSVNAECQLSEGVAENGKNPASVCYDVTLPADVPLGLAGIRVGTKNGVSNLRLILVDDLPSVAESGQNNSLAQAQSLNVPSAADGKIDPEQSDLYRIHLAAGEPIQVEVFARRLGFALDPVARLLDANGNELIYADDDPSVAPDCRFAYTAPAEADYFLEVRDIRYQGGDAHRYRLRVGRAPLGVIDPIENGDPGSESLAVSHDVEPPQVADAASPATLPRAFCGAFQTERDSDRFAFTGIAGTQYVFRARTRSLGSAADLFVKVLNADGASLAEVETAGGADGELRFTCPTEETYFLQVEELYRRAGADFRYRIEAQPYAPGFNLYVEAEKLDVPRGGVFVTKVTAERRDFNGPIELSIEGLGEHAKLTGQVIPEGQNETTLQATVDDALETGHFQEVRIVGTAKSSEQEVKAVAHTSRVMTAAFQGNAYPPASLDGAMALGVGPIFPEFFKLTLDRETIAFPRLVGATAFTVKAERLNGFEEAIALAVEGLPPGVTADIKPLEKGQAELAITLAGPALLGEGPYSVRITGNATFQNQPKRVVLAEVPLHVVDPLAAAAELAAPLKRGETAPLKIRLTRFGEATPVKLTLANLPPGVTTPAEVVATAEQTEVEIPLTSTPETPLGAANVTVIAQCEVKGQSIVVTTTAAIEVATP